MSLTGPSRPARYSDAAISRLLDRFSRLVTARPAITILVIILLTFVLAAGATRRAAPTEGNDVAYLPTGDERVWDAGVSDELLRSRLAEIDADYLDEDPISTRQRRRESISVEL